MSSSIVLQLTTEKDVDFIITKLKDNKLPTEDIKLKIDNIYLIEDGGKRIGIAGLEILGRYGLVRSIVVDQEFRNKGYGKSIIEALIKLARLKKLKELYLLTTSAEEFFSKIDFEKIDRDQVPEEIKSSDEFNSLCPVSAVCMKKVF